VNILILINNAPEYINFLKPLGDIFYKNDHKVIYACESHFPEIRYGVKLKKEDVYYFTEHSEKLTNYSFFDKNRNLRSLYYSCFDRNVSYNINKDKDKKMDDIILRLLSFFDKIIREEKIDLVIYENVSNSFAYSAFEMAKYHNAAYFGLITSRIPERFEIWEDEYGEIEKRRRKFEKLKQNDIDAEDLEEINNYIKLVQKSSAKPDYMINNPTSMNVSYFRYYINKLNIIFKIKEYYRKFPDEVKSAYQSSYPLKTSINSIARSFKRKLKIKKLIKLYDSLNEHYDSFFIYPIHFQPESSTSVNAMFYDNQYEAIKNIAFSLPIGTYLYVKDHPNGIGFANIEFYHKIKRLPNVKYIDPLTDTKNLIRKSRGIITLTSTMGYEALLLEKPVITIGKVFYNYHPYCKKVEGYSDLYEEIKSIYSEDYSEFHKINQKFLFVYFEDTYKGQIFSKTSNLEDIFNCITVKYNALQKSIC
jgi:hypothetical protein